MRASTNILSLTLLLPAPPLALRTANLAPHNLRYFVAITLYHHRADMQLNDGILSLELSCIELADHIGQPSQCLFSYQKAL